MALRQIRDRAFLAAALATASLWTTKAGADNEIRITYRADNRRDVIEYADAGDAVFAHKPSVVHWLPGVPEWSVQVQAVSDRDSVNCGRIYVSGDDNDTISLHVGTSLSNLTLSSYGLNNCGGIRLESNSTLEVYARIYGDLTGNIDRTINDPPIHRVNFACAGSIKSNVYIEGVDVHLVRGHIIEGGVTIEAADATGARIGTVRTGYTDNERLGVIGNWPTEGQMDIGTAASPVTLITPAGAGIDSHVTSMDDLFLDLQIGGHTTALRNRPNNYTGNYTDYSLGTPTRRMRITGETATLGNVFADSAYGGYLDTGTGDLRITSSTSNYAGTIEAIEGGTGANEVDFRGRFWFDAGIGASAVVRLNDAMDGEFVVNSLNLQLPWSPSSTVAVDGTNLSLDNPDYAHVPIGGGTIGMVDGVGNDLGFHLHHEACVPLSGQNGTNNISRSSWQAGLEWIYLEFYGPVYLDGGAPNVLIEWRDPQTLAWLTAAECTTLLNFSLSSSGANTGTNILGITGCPSNSCFIPLGEYRISPITGHVKSDLGLPSDPDVQGFYYYFTLVQ